MIRVSHVRTTALALALVLPTVLGAQDFTWSGTVARGNWVRTRNINGAVSIEQGTGHRVEITAIKKASRGGDTSLVKVEVRQAASGGDVIVCALWENRGTCDEDGYRSGMRNNRWDDDDDSRNVSVEFRVKVPAGVRIDASSVNGRIDIAGATSEVRASTVNGGITASSSGGPVRASTVNGGLDVRMGALSGTEELSYSTVNGSVKVRLPENVNADIELSTVNGSLETAFPITMQGRMDRHHIRARLGNGGPRLTFSTVNGSVELLKQ
jgi:Putative adhesin